MRQYRYGTTTTQALKTLYREGGVFRFYRGLGPALIQALHSQTPNHVCAFRCFAITPGSRIKSLFVCDLHILGGPALP